jgi:hypothetical protein
VGDAATKQAMVKRADEAHDTYLAVLCRAARTADGGDGA